MSEIVPERLTFPLGVRLAKPDEVPGGYEASLAAAAKVVITIGYTELGVAERDFSAYFEINAHAPTLWSLVKDAVHTIIPEPAAPIVGVKDDEPFLGPYTTREAILALFEPHAHLLENDGLIEFGIIHHYQGRLEEVFVKSCKYIQIWTNDPVSVRALLKRHRIPPVDDLRFIDEFPMVSETLRSADGNARWPEVVQELPKLFDQLPPPANERSEL
jgi:hypothetical protein